MKRLIPAAMAILLLTGLAAAQPKEADVAATLKGLEEKWSQAELKSDVAALNAILADTWISTSEEGLVRTKPELLRRLKAGEVKVQSSVVDDMRVFVYGEAAVVVGRWRGKGSENGKPFDQVLRWTDTFVRQNGQWRCVASQSTAIKANK